MKGQASMEFFALCGLAFIVLIIFASVSAHYVREFIATRDYNAIKDLGLKLQKEATLAASVEDGYSRSFSIPEKLLGTLNFSIITQNNTLTIFTSKTAYSTMIPQIDGNFTKGVNRLEKNQGVVHVSH